MSIERFAVFGSLVLACALFFSVCIVGLIDLRFKVIFKGWGDRVFSIVLGAGSGLFLLYTATTTLAAAVQEFRSIQNEEQVQQVTEQSLSTCLFINDGKCFVSRYMLLKTENDKLQLCAKYVETQVDGTEVKKEHCMDYNADRLPR
jgi:hypothetical protein